jgi:hypothetical protein
MHAQISPGDSETRIELRFDDWRSKREHRVLEMGDYSEV